MFDRGKLNHMWGICIANAIQLQFEPKQTKAYSKIPIISRLIGAG